MSLVYLVPSIIFFIISVFCLFKFWQISQENKKLKIELHNFTRDRSHDCQLLLASLMSGSALVKIEPIDPNDLFVWRPGRSR